MESIVDEAVAAIRARFRGDVRAGLILGTGLGNLASQIVVKAEIPYGQIPHFPCSTAVAHQGHLLCGMMGGLPVVTMAGRCHLYEGYSLHDVVLPVRVMHELGIDLLIVTNAAGGLNPLFDVGDVIVVRGHIDLMFAGRANDRIGLKQEEWSQAVRGQQLPRHQEGEMGEGWRRNDIAYDLRLIERAMEIARRHNFPLKHGVYVGVKGPNYETRAEYRAFRRLGGDVVGMSTIPEVVCARSLGLRVLALSTVTNVARPDAPQVVSSAEVIAMARQAEPKVRTIATEILAELA